MSICSKCNKKCNSCCCAKIESNTVINSNQAGRDGLSAYEIAVLEGKYSGTQEDFTDWLKGAEGPQGIKGDDGVSINNAIVDGNGDLIITLSDSQEINAGNVVGEGIQGDSAYQVAVNNGFIGTEGEWLESLKGEDGIQGPAGAPGQPGEQGVPGEDGSDGGTPEYRYATNGSLITPPTLPNTDREPSGWSLTSPSVPVGTYVWETVAIINPDNTLKTNWGNPIRVTGAQGAQGDQGNPGTPGQNGLNGPTSIFRGDWDEDGEYFGDLLKIELVKYNGQGYLTRTDSGSIPVGTLPTDTDYWNGPFPNIDAIFTDFLFSYSAYISNLTVGQLTTGPEPNVVPDPSLQGERYTVGFMPTGEIDPTANPNIFSRHGQRQYHPSGRIASYQGVVLDDFEYETEDGVETVVGFAWIVFKDEENSPVHFVVDSTTAKGIQYVTVTPPRWDAEALSKYLDFGLVAEEDDPKDYYTITYGGVPYIRNDEMCGYFDPFNAPNYGYAGIKVDNTPIFRRTPASNEPIQTVRYVTSDGGNTPVDDGWYIRNITIIQDGRQGNNAKININMDAFRTENGYITGAIPIEFLNQPFGDTIVPGDNVCPVYVERFELEP